MKLPGGLAVTDYRNQHKGPSHFVNEPERLVSPQRLVRLERQARLAATLKESPIPQNDGGARIIQAKAERRKLAQTTRDDQRRRQAHQTASQVTAGHLLRTERTCSWGVNPVSWKEVEQPPSFVESIFSGVKVHKTPPQTPEAPPRPQGWSVQFHPREPLDWTSYKPLERTRPSSPQAVEPVCGACAVKQLPRCAYCLMPKHSSVTRVPLAQLPRLLLAKDPAMKAAELGRRLAKYGRSDDSARQMNSDELGHPLPEKNTCDRHMKEWSLARQFELKCEKKYINEMTSFIKAREDYEDRIREMSDKAETQRLLFADAVEEADLYKNKNALLQKKLDATIKELSKFDDALYRKEMAEKFVDCSVQTDDVVTEQPSVVVEENQPKASAAALAFAQAAAQANDSGAEALAARIARKKAKPLPPLYETRALANELLAAKLRNQPEHEGHFADFLYAFWRSKDLTRKQVNVQVAKTIAAVDEHKSVDDTVRAVAILLGLETIKVGDASIKAGKSAWLAPAWFSVLRKLISEYLDPDESPDHLDAFLAARATAVLDPTNVAKAIAESASPEEEAPCVRQMLAPQDVGAVLKVILTLPSLPPKYGSPGGISFGDVSMLLLEHMAAAVARHHRKLLETFYRFDDDDNGLDGDEFRELLLWTTGDASNSETVHAEIEDLADADAEAHIQSGAIDEADQFPEVIMAATSGKLAYAESCRDYWRMEDDREWGAVKPKMNRKHTVGGNVLKEMATVGRSTTLEKLSENRVTFDESIKEPAPDGPASPLTP
ncbi:unnamed protein product [Pelagomonas calceolata]|uniref:EF-hand domain-containing protein n=1 Tax=Pelagomonas calceolata TaxID=35677 RepID=A0A8J2X3L1_9STRA|nr:unnamed protein product [Pelagomonas calceolata]